MGLVGRRRVEVDAPVDEVAMEVRDERTDVPAAEAGLHGLAAPVDEGLRGRAALRLDGVVDAVGGAAVRKRHSGVGQEELPDRGVEGEPVHTRAGGVDQHRARAVEDVASRDLGGPGLQEVLCGERLAHGRDAPDDAENRADADVHVNIGRPVERIDQHDVLADSALAVLAAQHKVLPLLGSNSAHALPCGKDAHERVVREDVEFLLLLVLNVGVPGRPENRSQTCAVDLLVHDFGRHPDVGEQPRELTRHKRKVRLPVHDEFAKCLGLGHCKCLCVQK